MCSWLRPSHCPSDLPCSLLRLVIIPEVKGYEVGCPVPRGFLLYMAGAGQECSFIVFFCFIPYLLHLGQKEKKEPKVTFFFPCTISSGRGRKSLGCPLKHVHGCVSLDYRKRPKGRVDQMLPLIQGPGTPSTIPPSSMHTLPTGPWLVGQI